MKKSIVIIVIAVVALAGFLWWRNAAWNSSSPSSASESAAGNASSSSASSQASENVPAFNRSLSDATITLSYPSADFGLATDQAQILTKSYIPPCDPSFNYCLYYLGGAYQGTNFESAGIRISRRSDLSTQAACLTSSPSGYSGLMPILASSSSASAHAPDYAASAFPSIGDAAAGHFAAGALYRLAYRGTCYEFEARIGQSDFGNYPSGAIREFTSADQSALQSELSDILRTVTLPGGEKVAFPTL